MSEAGPAPYPPDTRARGWRFELDYERIEQSDTWALAGAEVRPWLLMMWLTAWRQAPVGSLPADERVLVAKLGMPATQWEASREVMLRGWTLADDGRLYHPVITEQVLSMLAAKDKERTRKAAWRAKASASVPRDKTVTDAGTTPDSSGKDDTGTGTSIKDTTEERATPARAHVADDVPESAVVDNFSPTPAGRVCRLMRTAGGFGMCNPGDPRLLALLEQGVTDDEFVAVAKEAAFGGKSWAWLLKVVENRRADAARIHVAPPPPAPPWHDTKDGVIAKGKEIGVIWSEDGWVNVAGSRQHMAFPQYRAKVIAMAQQGVAA